MATILVVDDRPINRQFLVTLLGYAGHRLLEAADGLEALERARAEHPALVITDILMPRMDGVEFVRQMHADPALADMPVIFYTATYRAREARILAQSCGVSYVLPKPSEPEVILATVNQALGLAAPPVVSPALGALAEGAPEPLSRLAETLAGHLTDLQVLSQRTAEGLERETRAVERRMLPALLSDRFAVSWAHVETICLRLAALLEFSLDLQAERHPGHLLESCCRAAHHLVSARYAGLGILDEEEQALRYFFVRGMDEQTEAQLGAFPPRAGVFGRILADRRPYRAENLHGDARALGLPAEHPPIETFLGVPVATPSHTHGWLYLADKLGGEAFSPEDEQLALTLVGLVAVAYENAQLHESIQSHVRVLEQEIAERQLAEDALRAKEASFRLLFANNPHPMWVYDLSSLEFLEVNEAAITHYGYSSEEFLRLRITDIRPLEDLPRLLEDLEEDRPTLQFSGNWRHRLKDGRIIDVEIVSHTLEFSGRRAALVVAQDVTERKLAEDALRAKDEEIRVMSQQLWQAAKLATMGELAASIAHELNNPLATVSLRVESLLGQMPPDDPKRRGLGVIEQEVERMGALVANLLQFSRRGQQQISTLDVRKEIESTLELMQYHLRNHRITVVREFAPEVPMIHADRQQLRQVFLNLLTNASDAMPQGGTLTLRAAAGALDTGGPAVVIAFTDTGVGIAPEDLPKVMEPFFTTKGEEKGTGLGLAICRRIAQEHRGTFDLASGVGQGTTARLVLPLTNGTNSAYVKERDS